MDPVSCLYNFLSIGILCYFVIICFLIKKCCMNCGKKCAATDNLCKCFQKIYEGEITPSNHIILCDGDQRVPISYLLNQEENEREYIVGDGGVLYRNEACRECCMRDNVSHSSCNSQEDVFVIKTIRGKEICVSCSPSVLGLGQGSLRKTPSANTGPPAGYSMSSVRTGKSALSDARSLQSDARSFQSESKDALSEAKSAYSTKTDLPSCPATQNGSPCPASPRPSQNKGSSPTSIGSELQSVITPGVEPILSEPIRKTASARRSYQGVEFKAFPEKHIFPADGSIGSSIASTKGRGSISSQTSRTSCGSRASRKSIISRGSRVVSPGGGSSKSCASLRSLASRCSRSPTKTLISAKESQYSRGPGGIFYGPDGKPINAEGVLFGPDGKPLPPGVVMYGPDGKPLGPGGYMYGPDGILYGPDGKPYGEPGVVYGKDGKALYIYGPGGQQISLDARSIGPDGRLIGPDGRSMGADGWSIGPDGQLIGPDGRSMGAADGWSIGPDGRLIGPDGRSIGPDGCAIGPDGKPLSMTGSKTTRDLDAIPLTCDGSPDSSKKSPSPCKSLSDKSVKSPSDKSQKTTCGSSPGKSVCSAREAKRLSKSSSCISPCKSGSGTTSATAQKSKSSSFKSPCGTAGSPCPYKTGGKNIPVGSPGSKSARSVYQSSDPSTFASELISPTSTFSSHGLKTSANVKSPCGSCSKASGLTSRGAADKPPSPILKSPDDSSGQPYAKGVISPTRVSIKDKYDIITPEGITSAPTFGKDECKPCPFSKSNQSVGSTNTGRRNQVLADEYKDSTSNKRKADNISADYKDSTDISRGSKTARFSCNTNTCSQASSYKEISWPNTPSEPSKSATISTVATSKSSLPKCSKCSSKFSTVTDVTMSSSKTKPSATSSCVPSCNKSGVSSMAKSDYQTESVTTADIDDFRTVSPNSSRCENLGAALANTSCGKIRRLLKEVTCEAIRDPSVDVICDNPESGDECAGILYLKENATCPSLLEYINIVDKMSSGSEGGQGQGQGQGQKGSSKEEPCNRPSCPSTQKAKKLMSTCEQFKRGTLPSSPPPDPDPDSSKRSCTRCRKPPTTSAPERRSPPSTPSQQRASPAPTSSKRTCSRCSNRAASSSKTSSRDTRTMSAPGGPSGVDARVIHEISTKVQNCLNHARAIAKKIDGGAGAVECRKTMRVTAKAASKTASQSVKLNSKVMLNTRGVRINEYNKVNKQFGSNTGIEVKYKDKQGNVEKFKKPYSELITAGTKGAINIRISSPCKSTPGKKLCISTEANPCCTSSDSTRLASRADVGATRKHSPPRVKIVESKASETDDIARYREESETTDQECPDPEICRQAAQRAKQAAQKSDQECPDPEVCRRGEKRKKGKKETIIMYERSTAHSKSKRPPRKGKVECTPSCTHCMKTSCPASKYYKKSKKNIQVYNVTTSHFATTGRASRPHIVKGMQLVENRIMEQYIYPDRYRGGENYLKKRRELIKKIKRKCPWT